MQNEYPVITLCGSTKFKKEFLEVQKRLTLEGYIVISVGFFGHSGDGEVWDGMDEGSLSKTKEMLDDMHKRKIDMADLVYVINVGGYIGESTKSEIEYAKKHGKEVKYLEEPQESEEKIDVSKLSDDAIKILEYATDCMTGSVKKESGVSGSILIPGRYTVLNKDDQCESEKWDAALKELLAAGFIQQVDQTGGTYRVDTAGYEYMDKNWSEQILFSMPYDEYVRTLLEKYGAVSGDYYLDDTCKYRNEFIIRPEDGLYVHHIDEDKIPGLSNMNKKRMQECVTFDYHKAGRLVYCHFVEHMILHMKIIEKELTKTMDERYRNRPLGISGFVAIAADINFLFTGYGVCHNRYMSESREIYWKSFNSTWTTRFVKAIKYFVENIERRIDFQNWYGDRENFVNWYKSDLNDLLDIINRIYGANPIDFKGMIGMGDYKGIYNG